MDSLSKLIETLNEDQKKILQEVIVDSIAKNAGRTAEASIPVGVKERRRDVAMPRRVYFFLQTQRFLTSDKIEVKQGDDGKPLLIKHVEPGEQRVISVDERMASKLMWNRTFRQRFSYIGRSPGKIWASERNSGKTVQEAQEAEFKWMLENRDTTPPPNKERTLFVGRKISEVSRGAEVELSQGLGAAIGQAPIKIV